MSGHLDYEFSSLLLNRTAEKLRIFPSLIHADSGDAEIVCRRVG